MNTIERIIIILIPFLTIGINGLGQTTHKFQYSYDPAGNRIQRIMLPNRLSAATNDSLPVAKSMISGKQISIYPNPTSGELTVQIESDEPVTDTKAEVSDMSGRIVFTKERLTNFTSIDLTAQPSGNYLLRIWVEGKRREWIVVKPEGR